MDTVKKIISTGTWVLFIVLFAFSILAGVAQSSNPGDKTYGFKLQFEKGLLVLSSVFDNTANLQIGFTKNRAKEVQHVFASNQATVGITNLNIQIEATKKTIQEIKDPVKKADRSEKYISLLNEVSTQLTADKQILQSNSPADRNLSPTVTFALPTRIPTPTISVIIPTVRSAAGSPSPTPQPVSPAPPAPATVTTAIDQTQEKIQETIDELRNPKNENENESSDTNSEEKTKNEKRNGNR